MTWRQSLVAGLLMLAIILPLLFAVDHYRLKLKAQQQTTEQLQRDIDQQSSVIATQSLQFNRFNQIASAAGDYAVKLQANTQEKEIVYRTILKTEPTCALDVPADIAGRLLDYANGLRASAMHTDPGITDRADTGPTATGTLTYCQAVLWIDLLLSAIDKANSQFEGIRQIEASRQTK